MFFLSVAGGAGHKSFDPDRSDVLRLLQEEETIKKRGYGLRGPPQGGGAPVDQSARYEEQQGEMNYQVTWLYFLKSIIGPALMYYYRYTMYSLITSPSYDFWCFFLEH